MQLLNRCFPIGLHTTSPARSFISADTDTATSLPSNQYSSDWRYLTGSIPYKWLPMECPRPFSLRWKSLSLGYTHSDGHPELRKEIARLYDSVSPDEVLVLIPQEAIQIAARAMLQSGDHVVCIAPAYQSLFEDPLSLGCTVSYWEMHSPPDGRPTFRVEDLQKAMQPNTRAVFVNFPHNPTGAVPSVSEWQKIMAYCRECNAYLFSDEMYRLLEYEPTQTLASAVDIYEKSVVLSGMSKSMGMPGIRSGWLATKDKALYQRFQCLHDYYSICHAAPSEVLALIALRNRSSIVAKNKELVQANIQLATSFFDRHKDKFRFHAPQGSSTAFPRLITGESIELFCDRVVKDCGVFLLPATVYDHQKSIDEGRFRIGLGRSNFKEGLDALDKYLVSHKAA